MMSRFLLAAALAAAPMSAAAQEGGQANLVLSLSAGVHTGHALWTTPRQPLLVPNSTEHDTLRLVRTISPGLVLAFSGTYFSSPHFGFHGGISYFDLGMENSCEAVAPYVSDPERRNEQVCDNLTGTITSNSTILIGGGVTARAAPRGGTSPYVRAGAAWAIHSNTTVGTASAYISGGQVFGRQILSDPSPRKGSLVLQFAAGITQPIGSGYQLRLEVRDDFFALDRADGIANALGDVAIASSWYHHWTLTLGFDVVLERRRPRRY